MHVCLTKNVSVMFCLLLLERLQGKSGRAKALREEKTLAR